MFSDKGLKENFQFMVVRVRRQLEDTLGALEFGDGMIPDRMKLREDHIDNLKITIERKSYRNILKSTSSDDRAIRLMSSLNTAASNLEEIGDYLINIVSQIQYFRDPVFIGRFDYHAYFRLIGDALDLAAASLFKGIIKDALAICHTEPELDRLYKQDFETVMAMLKEGREVEDGITALNIFHYLERIGDSLLNIGEAVISTYAGTRLKVFEYLALKENLAPAAGTFKIQNMHAETRSGCRIEKIVAGDLPAEGAEELIFKEGELGKIEQERDKLGYWQQVMPGLTPKIYGYQTLNSKAFMLLECIGGMNFQEIVMIKDDATLQMAFVKLKDVVNEVWGRTLADHIRPAHFMRQLQRRLSEVYEVHSSFNIPRKSIGDLTRPPFLARLARAEEIEATLDPPFSVFVHGDFNADNVIYDPVADRIHYIDVHRSGDLDYVQDVSVFLVSNFRLPLFNPDTRRRLSFLIEGFYSFGADFAGRHDDATFDARLALGLIRSLVSSTRFILNEAFAKTLYLRGVYLLDRFLEHEGRPWGAFRIPREVLSY